MSEDFGSNDIEKKRQADNLRYGSLRGERRGTLRDKTVMIERS